MLVKHLGLALLLAAMVPASALAAGSSSGGVDVSAGYVPDAVSYTNGHRKDAQFHYHGSRASVMVHAPFQYKQAKGTVGLYGHQQILVNNYQEASASGDDGTETLSMLGAGIQGILVSDWTGNLQVNLAIGADRVEVKQSGDTPKTQLYAASPEGRFGLGVGPMIGASGVFFRVEYQMIALWNGKPTSGEDEKLRNAWVESYAPVLGFMLAF